MLSYMDRASQIQAILSVGILECCFRLSWVTILSPSNRRGSRLRFVVERNFIESTRSHTGFFRSFLLSCCGVLRHSDNPETDLSRPPAFKEVDTSEQIQHELRRGMCLYRPQTGIRKASRWSWQAWGFLFTFRVYLLFENKWHCSLQWWFNIKRSIKKV